MRAFLFYIDDWLSSKRVALMDAHEERGYLRLLLAAATESDCGLPDEDSWLAITSLLGSQWFRPTKERSKRVAGKTSGQKVRECFELRDGRLYNARLLKEWNHQREVSEAKRNAGILGGRPRKHMVLKQEPYGLANGKQTETNDVCASGFVFGDSEENADLGVFSDERAGEGLEAYISIFRSTGKPLNSSDLDKTEKIWMARLPAYRSAAYEHAKRESRMWAGDSFTPFPNNHLRDHPWDRKGNQRTLPPAFSRSDSMAMTAAIYGNGPRCKNCLDTGIDCSDGDLTLRKACSCEAGKRAQV